MKNVLIVDDSKIARFLIKEELEKLEDTNIIEASNGFDALDIINKTNLDFITINIIMKGMDGFELCRKIKQNKKMLNTPVILITGKDNFFSRIRGFNVGAIHFFNKNEIKDNLYNFVRDFFYAKNNSKDINILVVINSPLINSMIKYILDRHGYKTLSTDNPLEAIKIMNQNKIDLFIIDLFLPEINGIELTKKIRNKSEYTNTPIIMTASNNDKKNMLDAFNAGINDYIVKPFLYEEFISRINVHLKRFLYEKELKNTNKTLENLLLIQKKLISILSQNIKIPLINIANIFDYLKTLEHTDITISLTQSMSSYNQMISFIEDLLYLLNISSFRSKAKSQEIDVIRIVEDCIYNFLEKERITKFPISIEQNIANNKILFDFDLFYYLITYFMEIIIIHRNFFKKIKINIDESSNAIYIKFNLDGINEDSYNKLINDFTILDNINIEEERVDLKTLRIYIIKFLLDILKIKFYYEQKNGITFIFEIVNPKRI